MDFESKKYTGKFIVLFVPRVYKGVASKSTNYGFALYSKHMNAPMMMTSPLKIHADFWKNRKEDAHTKNFLN